MIARRLSAGSAVLLVVSVSLFFGSTVLATVAWVPASGSNAAFGYSSGLNNTGRFGNPTASTRGFLFDQPNNFRAEGGGGSGGSVTDFARTTVDVSQSVPSGAPAVHRIVVREWGTWSEDISAPTDFGFQLDFRLFRYVPDTIPPPLDTGSLTVPVTFYPDGTWYAQRALVSDSSALDWSRFRITVTNTIQVWGTAPAGSFIEKAGMEIVVPEPASVVLLLGGLGSLMLGRRR